MSIYQLTLSALVVYVALLYAERWCRYRSFSGSSFLESLLSKLRTLVAVALVIFAILSILLIILSFYYRDGAPIYALQQMDFYREKVSENISRLLPEPWLLAIAAFLLVFISALIGTGPGILQRLSKRLASIFLALQPPLNWLAVCCCIISTLSFATTNNPAERSWVTLELAEALGYAHAIDDGIASIAMDSTADELLDSAMRSLDESSVRSFLEAQSELIRLRARYPLPSNVTMVDPQVRLNSLIDRVLPRRSVADYNLSSNDLLRGREPLGKWAKFSVHSLAKLANEIAEFRRALGGGGQSTRVESGIRALFYENVSKAVIDKQFRVGSKLTGNPFVDILLEAVNEAAVEQAREHFSSRLGRMLRLVHTIDISGLRQSFKNILVRSELAEPKPTQSADISTLQSLAKNARYLAEASDYDANLKKLQNRDCPAGQIRLTCNGGVSFCGAPELVGRRCR